jgi:hypothetical protein
MNDLIEIKVFCYSGYKSEEYPRYFEWDDIGFDIKDILDRWHQCNLNPEFPTADYFKVLTADNKIYILKHEIIPDKWFLWIKGESINL